MTTVLTHGCFDLLHVGHIRHLESAKKLGGPDAKLIVSITADRFVNKGPGRPHFKQDERSFLVKALSAVDAVFINDAETAVSIILEKKPDLYVKGPDYAGIVDEKLKLETDALDTYGGKLAFTQDEACSSSELLNRYFDKWTDDQKETIELIKNIGGLKCINDAFDKLSKSEATLVGEPIHDVYVFCSPGGISSKSPSLSARFLNQEVYRGGVWAVEALLREFTNVTLLPTTGTITKTRFIWPDKMQTMFELTNLSPVRPADGFYDGLSKSPLIICDFGHGLFGEEERNEILNKQGYRPGFVALNVQTNSSNFGFNRYDRYSNFDYLCIDTREARLAFGDLITPVQTLAKQIAIKNEADVSVTLGSSGSCWARQGCEFETPAFSGEVIDAVGAGDAYFGITAALRSVGTNPMVCAFVGNVCAGIKTGILGHRQSVTKRQLLKTIESILK